MVNLPRLRPEQGFSLMEVLMGFFVLAIAFVMLGAYQIHQRKALYRSGELSDATQVAISALEKAKGDLADPARFATAYKAVKHKPALSLSKAKLNQVAYTVDLAVSRGIAANGMLKAQVNVVWLDHHRVVMGVLIAEPL